MGVSAFTYFFPHYTGFSAVINSPSYKAPNTYSSAPLHGSEEFSPVVSSQTSRPSSFPCCSWLAALLAELCSVRGSATHPTVCPHSGLCCLNCLLLSQHSGLQGGKSDKKSGHFSQMLMLSLIVVKALCLLISPWWLIAQPRGEAPSNGATHSPCCENMHIRSLGSLFNILRYSVKR